MSIYRLMQNDSCLTESNITISNKFKISDLDIDKKYATPY